VNLIVLLCRNNFALSRACLKTLRAHTLPAHILVIDNASTDGTKQWLKVERGIRVISHAEPVSVAQAWNDALRWAWSAGYHEALVVNNDTELLPETYQTLSDWAAADPQGLGMVTCVSRRERAELAYEKPFTSRANPDFSCYLIQRWAWERVGGFDENYLVAFGEDCEMHVRMHRLGIMAECISLPFLHHGSQTIKQTDEIDRRRIGRQADRNRQHFFEKWGRRVGTKGYEDLFRQDTFGVGL
jgi:O-antigen biosynthesis protein